MTPSSLNQLRAAAIALALLGSSAPAYGQTPAPATPTATETCRPKGAEVRNRMNGFRLYEENDSFVLGDNRYTQGLRLHFSWDPRALPCFAQRARGWRFPGGGDDGFRVGLSLIGGQNLYTPTIITTRNLERNDRGYADLTYAGLELTMTTVDQRLRHTIEISAGAFGIPAFARGTQGGLHILKTVGRVPKGWESTNPFGVAVHSRYQFDRRLLCASGNQENCYLAGYGGVTGELGNVRTAAGIHAAAKAGYGVSGFPIPTIGVGLEDQSDRTKGELSAVVQWEGRGNAYTALVRASPDTRDFGINDWVTEYRLGGEARYESLRLTGMLVNRSAEFSIAGTNAPAQKFLTVTLSYEPTLKRVTVPSSSKPIWKWLGRGLGAELGMGGAVSGPTTDTPPSPRITAILGAKKEIWNRVSLGFEMAAAAVEGLATPGEPGNRSDLILNRKIVTAGWAREFRFGQIGARAGMDVGGVARNETIYHLMGSNGRLYDFRDKKDVGTKRGGWMTGVRYVLPIERHMSIGFDASLHRVSLAQSLPGLKEANYGALLAVLQFKTRGLREKN